MKSTIFNSDLDCTDLTPASFPENRHPVTSYLLRLGLSSRRVMSTSLDVISRVLTRGRCDRMTLPWISIRYPHATVIRAALAEHYAPATANRILAALKGVLKECWRLGLLQLEDLHRAIDIPPVRGERLPAGREVPPGELARVFDACSGSSAARATRDAAMFAILYSAGVRRSELVAVDRADYIAETGEMTVRHGKGNKQRIVYVARSGREAIAAWLNVRGDWEGPLLCAITKSGTITRRRLTPQAVLYIVQRRADEAGVVQFTPHDLRRTFITHLLNAGCDIEIARRLAGHAQVGTTARYDRRGEGAKRAATERLVVPYRQPQDVLDSRQSDSRR